MRSARFSLENMQKNITASRLCRPDQLPLHRAPRFVVGQAIAESLERSFSGTTLHLAQAGMASGTLEGCFSLYARDRPDNVLRGIGALWKLSRYALRRKPDGFKFSEAGLDYLWRKNIRHLAGTSLLNNFQLYGGWYHDHCAHYGIGTNYYIDGTLSEYFESYESMDTSNLDRSTQAAALAMEQAGYKTADRIIVMSRRSAHKLQTSYGVPESKIHVVPPGANLPDDIGPQDRSAASAAKSVFTLGFIGLYPLRKGLDTLAAALHILRSRGLSVRLRVIGRCPDEIKGQPGVEYVGEIDKVRELARFVREVRTMHLGCLLSRAELAGIALLEFIRLGIPVIGTDVGGATDILEGSGSLMVAPSVTAEQLADVIAPLIEDRDRYAALSRDAELHADWASWRRAAHDIDDFLSQDHRHAS
jgi:glycosyltransferase involved in cell wall biosynthesis